MHVTRTFRFFRSVWCGPDFPGNPEHASAQPARKAGIALVVGQWRVRNRPLERRPMEPALIAKNLAGGGLDVVARPRRDLDGDTLRPEVFATSSRRPRRRSGTVAMVYLAGYGIQIAAKTKNYFIQRLLDQWTPDVPAEGCGHE